jgi:hypothetical protein
MPEEIVTSEKKQEREREKELVPGGVLSSRTIPELEWKVNFSEKDGSVTWSLEIPEANAILSGYPAQFSSWQALVELHLNGTEPKIIMKDKLGFSQAYQFVVEQLKATALFQGRKVAKKARFWPTSPFEHPFLPEAKIK